MYKYQTNKLAENLRTYCRKRGLHALNRSCQLKANAINYRKRVDKLL